MIITLCGSTRFEELFMAKEKELTGRGHTIFRPNTFFSQKHKDNLSKETMEVLEEIHREKINKSHAIYVINPNGYIGDSTEREIGYALCKGKKVYYLQE